MTNQNDLIIRQETRYLVQCRLSREFIASSLQFDIDQESLYSFVLFAFTFSASYTQPDLVRAIASSAFYTALDEVSRSTWYAPAVKKLLLESVEVREGSLIVDIFVQLPSIVSVLGALGADAVRSNPVAGTLIGGVIGISTRASFRWIADKFVGGAVGRIGELITENTAERISGKRAHIQKPSTLSPPNSNSLPIIDLEKNAKQMARHVAEQHFNCNIIPTKGGHVHGDLYSFTYQLDCLPVRTIIVQVYGHDPSQTSYTIL